jgi:hypothetical protein
VSYVDQAHKVNGGTQADTSPASVQGIEVEQNQNASGKVDQSADKVHTNAEPSVAHPQKVVWRIVVVELH